MLIPCLGSGLIGEMTAVIQCLVSQYASNTLSVQYTSVDEIYVITRVGEYLLAALARGPMQVLRTKYSLVLPDLRSGNDIFIV